MISNFLKISFFIFCSLSVCGLAHAQTVDDFINQLADDSPESRARAAYELGGG